MFNEIKDTILEFAEPDFEITEETGLKTELGLSSFEMVCLLDRLCELNKVEIPEKDFRLCITVGDLCKCVEKLTTKGAATV